MKCQHCGSKDIISIQGQNFCLNCGVEVLGQVVPVIKEQKAPMPSKKNEQINQIQDNARYAPAAKPQVSQTAAAPKAKVKKPSPSNGSVHPLQFALKVSSALAAFAGVLIGGALWFELDNDLFLHVAISGIAVIFIMVTLAQAALLYGFAKTFDGYPASHRLWWAAARNGFMEIMNIYLFSFILLLVMVGIDVALWQYTVSQPAFNIYAQAGIIGIANAAIAWALLGTYVAKRLAVPAVVIGGLTTAQALKIGWRFYLKAGGHLVAAALEIAVARVFAVALIGLVAYLGLTQVIISSPAALAVAGGLLAALVSFMAAMTFLEVEMRIWQRQYRQWAGMLPTALRSQLTTGRIRAQQKPV